MPSLPPNLPTTVVAVLLVLAIFAGCTLSHELAALWRQALPLIHH